MCYTLICRIHNACLYCIRFMRFQCVAVVRYSNVYWAGTSARQVYVNVVSQWIIVDITLDIYLCGFRAKLGLYGLRVMMYSLVWFMCIVYIEWELYLHTEYCIFRFLWEWSLLHVSCVSPVDNTGTQCSVVVSPRQQTCDLR